MASEKRKICVNVLGRTYSLVTEPQEDDVQVVIDMAVRRIEKCSMAVQGGLPLDKAAILAIIELMQDYVDLVSYADGLNNKIGSRIGNLAETISLSLDEYSVGSGGKEE